MKRTAKKTVKKMTGLQRLKRLVVVLERVKAAPKKRKEFDMSVWAVKTLDCGTHLCACGWGASDPVLRRQGLVLEFNGGIIAHPAYAGLTGYEAIESFFGLGAFTAEHLFSPNMYSDGKKMAPVIARIKAQIKEIERQAA